MDPSVGTGSPAFSPEETPDTCDNLLFTTPAQTIAAGANSTKIRILASRGTSEEECTMPGVSSSARRANATVALSDGGTGGIFSATAAGAPITEIVLSDASSASDERHVATFYYRNWSIGDHTIRASAPIGSDTLAMTIRPGTPTGPDTRKRSQTITFGALADRRYGSPDFSVSATASSTLPVTFASTTPLVCTMPTATTVHLVTVGTCSILATQGGNATYAPAPPVSRSLSVGRAITSTSVSSSRNASVFGESVTFTATIGGPGSRAATGRVEFFIDRVSVGSVALVRGRASISTSVLPVGKHTVSARYGGNSKVVGSARSLVGGQIVDKADTTVVITNALELGATNTVVGQTYAVAASVSANLPGAGIPPGVVTISDGGANCTIALANGSGSCSLVSMSPGARTISADYSGEAGFNGSTTSIGHTVDQAPTTIPQLSIVKTWTNDSGAGTSAAGTGIAKVGDMLTFTLAYGVAGASVSNAVITDVLPQGLAYIAGSATASTEFAFQGYDPGTLTLRWTAPRATTNGSLTYRVQVAAGSFDLPQPLRNVATIDSDETGTSGDSAGVGVQRVLAETSTPSDSPAPPGGLDNGAQASSRAGFELLVTLVVLSGMALLSWRLSRFGARSWRGGTPRR